MQDTIIGMVANETQAGMLAPLGHHMTLNNEPNRNYIRTCSDKIQNVKQF